MLGNAGAVKKVGSLLKIVHDKYSKDEDAREDALKEVEEAAMGNKELMPFVGKVQEDLNPLNVLGLLQNVIPEVKRTKGGGRERW